MHSIPKSKDISALKELPLASMHKKLNDFHKKFTMFKKRNPQTKEKQDLKEKVKENIRDIFNEMHCCYKWRYSEEKVVSIQKTKNWDSLIIMSKSLKKKKENKVMKSLENKSHLKNQQNLMWKNLMNWLIKNKRT